MIKVMIVDDEVPAREELKYHLSRYDDIQIIFECKNGLELLNKLEKMSPDVVFLDINMPKISGIEVAEEIMHYKTKNTPFIVFTTAYDEYAIKAFEVNAIDYLLKPIDDRRLDMSINKLKDKLKENKVEYENKLSKLIDNINDKKENTINKLTLYKEGIFYPIDIENIILATIENKNTTLYTVQGKFLYHETLTYLEEKINKENFYRSHRSYLINIDFIERIEPWFNNTYHVKLKGHKDMVPVSRGQVKEFKVIMNLI